MSEVTKNFSFNSTLENWIFTPSNSAVGTRDTTEDSSNDPNAGTGVLQNRTTGKNQNTAGSYWEWGDGSTLTWESLGVPAGATVTAVNLDYDWKVSEFNTGKTNSVGPAELRDSGGTGLTGTFSVALDFSTTTSWAERTGTVITGLSDVSNTLIRLRITGNTSTGNSASGAVTLRQDWIQVTVTYTIATVPLEQNETESLTFSDVQTAQYDTFFEQNESLTLTDELYTDLQSTLLEVNETESLTFVDEFASYGEYFFESFETIVFSDETYTELGGTTTYWDKEETLSLDDTFGGLFEHFLDPTDSITLTDELNNLFEYILQPTESFILTDDFESSTIEYLFLSEFFTLDDIWVGLFQFIQDETDDFIQTDGITANFESNSSLDKVENLFLDSGFDINLEVPTQDIFITRLSIGLRL